MDSKGHHLSSSTTQATATPPTTDAPKVSYSSPSVIRAPLTVDSDIECYLSTHENSDSSYSTDSVSESDSHVSVEEEFVEAASVRPFVTNPDDETIEGTLNLNYAGSSKQSLEFGEYDDSMPFVDGADEETSEEMPLEREWEDEYVFQDDEASVVDIGVSLLPKPAMPIAQLSANSDDDSVISEVVEDDGFSGAVHGRVTVLSDDLYTAPRVKVRCVGDEEDESESDNVLEPEVVEDLISAEAVSMIVSSGENDGDMFNDIVEDSHDLDVIKEANFESLEASKNFAASEDSNLEDNEKQVVEEVDLEKNRKEGSNSVEIDENVALEIGLLSTEMIINNNEDRVMEGGGAIAATVSPLVECLVKSEYLEPDKIVGSTDEVDLVVSKKGTDDSSGVDLGGIIYDWEGDNDNKQSETEERAKSVVASCDSVAARKTESMVGAIWENDILTMDFTSYSPEITESDVVEDQICGKFDILELNTDAEIKEEGDCSGGDVENNILGNSNTEEEIAAELEQRLDCSSSAGSSSHDDPHGMEESVVCDSDEDVETVGETERQEIFDSSALIAFLRAATAAGSDGGSFTLPWASADGSRVSPVDRPVGLGSSFLPLRLTPQSNRSNSSSKLTSGVDKEVLLSEEEKETEKLQQIQVKFMRLVWRLGLSFENSVVGHVLHGLAIAAERSCSKVFSFDSARRAAMELEVNGDNDLSFSLNVLFIGKTGVGKSATINSIFGEEKTITSAFEPATGVVQEVVGTIDGIKLRVLDTPGLLSSQEGQRYNRKILSSIQKFVKKFPPDVVLYVDRADTPARDFNDLPMIQSITSYLGSSIWRNAIITLTHVTSTPLDGPSGYPLSCDAFVDSKSLLIRRLISRARGDRQMTDFCPLNPVSLVDNHPLHDANESGESWRSHLLLLCYSMKILSETSFVVKNMGPFDHQNLLGLRLHAPPVCHFLSQLLQSHAHPKLPGDEGFDGTDMEIGLECMSDSDEEVEREYDELPPFKPLKKSQVAKLTKEQRKAYFEEYDYRVKLFQKKQWREEMKVLRDIKKKGNNGINDDGGIGDYGDQETENPAIGKTSRDIAVPPSFDNDTPAYRYRVLELNSQIIVRPVPCVNGWDHDHGFDGVFHELNLAIAGQFPALITVNLKKDKEEFKLDLNSSISAKCSGNISTMAGVNIQTIGKQLAYVLKGEAETKMFKVNRMASGLSLVLLGENVMPGFKIEDCVMVGKQMALMGTAVAIRSQGSSAYSANMEVHFRERDFPIGQDQTTIGLCLTKWRDELVWGCNLQSQFGLGRRSKLVVHTSLNNKLNGKISVTASSSEQLQIAILGLLPLARTIISYFFPRLRENHSIQ